jgi:hypothetical protein
VADGLTTRADQLAGKVVVDITNPLTSRPSTPDRPGRRLRRAEFTDALPRTRVLKPFNAPCCGSPRAPVTPPSGPPSKRLGTDAATAAKVAKLHQVNFWVYGARKLYAQLVRQDHPVARRTVERLVRNAGLYGITRATGSSGPGSRGLLTSRSPP